MNLPSRWSCHPERSLPRFLWQTESKDLRLFFSGFSDEALGHHTRRLSPLSPWSLDPSVPALLTP